MHADHLRVCVIGAGPRGLSVVERLCANEREAPSHARVTIHAVDPSPPGAGAVWRTDQSRFLLMNTVASQITLYTDASARISGPIEEGPSLYEWAQNLLRDGTCDARALTEAKELGPDTYPTRAFYGRYLNAGFDQIVARAPDHVHVRVHRTRAVAVDDADGVVGAPQRVRLEAGPELTGLDAVVLALGHVPSRLSRRQERTARLAGLHGLTYVTPANPADLDLSAIEPETPVLLRGLGLNFFDHMALFTLGRGGVFIREDDHLVYRPSGRETRLYASSRRGVPYHSRGENEKGVFRRHEPRLLTAETIAGLHARAAGGDPVQFGRDLWPLIAREVESVYYGTLLDSCGRGDERAAFVERYLFSDIETVLDEFRIDEAQRWDWDRLSRPYRGIDFAGRAEFQAWMRGYLRKDVREARAGNVSGPLKSALDVLRDLRNEIRLAVDHGGVDGRSYRDDLSGWYTPLNAFLSIGPPVSRIEEMIALMEAGILVMTGPDTHIRIDTGTPAFVAWSGTVPGPAVRAPVLIEARLPEPDLRRTGDPLLRRLKETGQGRTYRIAGAGGTSYETGGLAVTERPYHVVDVHGDAHPRRFAYGVPTESVHWVTAAGIRPGVDSVTLGDSDAIARALLQLSPARTDELSEVLT